TGLAQVPGIASNSFRPGAVADTLTSYGGLLPSVAGQMPVTDWLDGGATASYGTVEEPCNFTQKFSSASVLIDQYYRGGSLIEAYWKAVQWPGQGLFVGEPLAQPFPERPSFTLEGGRYVIKSRALRPHSNYSLDYRSSASGSTGGSWSTLASFNTTPAALQTLSAALPPADALQLRWVGPCPANIQQQCTLSSSP
ncbi:TIGR03790 family protein, partial [Roseateles sp. GG27B]